MGGLDPSIVYMTCANISKECGVLLYQILVLSESARHETVDHGSTQILNIRHGHIAMLGIPESQVKETCVPSCAKEKLRIVKDFHNVDFRDP